MNILITGGNGYIAKSLANEWDNVTSITRKDFDLIDREATNNWFKGKYFDVVIHTAIKGGSRLQKDDSNVFYQNSYFMCGFLEFNFNIWNSLFYNR